jgi:chloramphenicol 3-O phosphotransferase
MTTVRQYCDNDLSSVSPQAMNSVAVILNGTSSSGKTSIAKALQRLSSTPVLHVSIDAFLNMVDWSLTRSTEERAECFHVCLDGFHAALPSLATSRYLIVVDHVFEVHSWSEACRDALRLRKTFFVGIHCPLDILEEREKTRGDRMVGLAKSQFDLVHDQKSYALQIDTSTVSPEEGAAAILELIHNETVGSQETPPK